MPKITPGNELYLYQLFSRELGIGRQTLASKVEEVLRKDGIDPYDLGCDSTKELLDALSGFVKVTTFKRGNVYATVLRREDLDEMLLRATQGSEGKKQAGKPWKRHGGKKTPYALQAPPPREARPEGAREASAGGSSAGFQGAGDRGSADGGRPDNARAKRGSGRPFFLEGALRRQWRGATEAEEERR